MNNLVPIRYISIEGTDFSDIISNFSYEDSIEIDAKLDLTINPDDGIYLLDSGVISKDKEISFYFGYMGGLTSKVQKLKIADIKPQYTNSGISIKLVALADSHKMKRTSENIIWGNGKKEPIKNIVSKIAEKYNMKFAVDSTNNVINMPQKGLSDFAFLQSLATLEKGGEHIVYTRNNTLYFVKRNTEAKSIAVYNYGADDRIVSFSPSETTSDKSELDGEVSIKSVESKDTTITKQDKTVKLSLQNGVITKILGKTKNVVGKEIAIKDKTLTKFNSQTSLVQPFDSDNKQGAKDLSDSIDNKAKLNIRTATLVVESDPTLEPDCIITMEGKLLKADIGEWYITKVVHNSITTTMEIKYIPKKESDKAIKPTSNSSSVKNSIGKKGSTGNDEIVVHGYDKDGNVIYGKTKSGKIIPNKQ